MGGEKFLVGLRGAKKLFNRVSDRFSDPFSRFSNCFSYRFKMFSGANSFCTRAALKNSLGNFGASQSSHSHLQLHRTCHSNKGNPNVASNCALDIGGASQQEHRPSPIAIQWVH